MIVSFTWLQDSNLQAWATAQIQIGNISYAEYVYDHFTQLESKQLNLDVVNPANTSSITIYLAHPTSVLLLCNSIIKNWKDFENAMGWCLLNFLNIVWICFSNQLFFMKMPAEPSYSKYSAGKMDELWDF